MKTTLSSGTTSVPKVGFRFHPTEKEILNYYLKRKNLGCEVRAINEVNVCKFEPWDLPDQSDEGISYFFSRRDLKNSKSKLSNRTTKEGYWKSTGKPRRISFGQKQIGSKRTLVFHHGRPKGRRTDWIIHEYDFCASSNLQGNFVLCRLKRKTQKIGQDQPACFETTENEHQNEVTEMLTDEGCESSFTAPRVSMDQIPTSVSAPLIPLGDGVSPPMAPSNLENQTSVAFRGLGNQMLPLTKSFPLTMTPSNLENFSSTAPFNNIENTSTPSNLENQTLLTPSNLENQISILPFNAESMSLSSLESLESQISFYGQDFSPMTPSNLENVTRCCSEVIPPASTAFNLESYLPVVGESTHPTLLSHYLKMLSSYLEDDLISISDIEKCQSTSGEGQYSPLLSPFNSYEKGDSLLTSNFHNQNLAYGEGGHSPMANPFTSRYESPDEKGDCLFISDLEIPTPTFDSEVGESSPVLVGSSDSDNQPISIENTSSSFLNPPVADPSSFHEPELMQDDFGKLNSEEKADIPVTQDGVPSSLKLTPPEFKNQNANETSSPEENYWSLLTSLDLESGQGQATITEVRTEPCLVDVYPFKEYNFGSEDELSPWGLWD